MATIIIGQTVSHYRILESVAIAGKWQVSPHGGAFPRWRRDGKELFYVAPGDEFMVAEVGAKGGTFSADEVRPLFRHVLSLAAPPYDVSPDGQRFLINDLAEKASTPLTLVTNWKELLKNK